MFDSNVTREQAMNAKAELENGQETGAMTLGSIKALADKMGMSYKAALDLFWEVDWPQQD